MSIEQAVWIILGGLVTLAVLVFLCTLYIAMRAEAMHARTRVEASALHREFLANHYEQLTTESTAYHRELKGLISEVQVMAKAFREALSREDWDPEQHLAILERLDEELARMSTSSPPL